ncbi:hypothetical protein ACVWZR_005831 [Bradyrhizobium sp. i1.3.1]
MSESRMLTNAVSTASGPIIGAEQNGIRAFKGVPFATARRFARATPPLAWTEPRQCTDYGAYAPQPGHLDHADEESCLSLNIWAPAADHPLPVKFFIHGGAFVTGAAAPTITAPSSPPTARPSSSPSTTGSGRSASCNCIVTASPKPTTSRSRIRSQRSIGSGPTLRISAAIRMRLRCRDNPPAPPW